MDLAKEWIKSCRQHPICTEDPLHSSLKDFYPTRLLDVGEGVTPHIRLVKSSKLPNETLVEYAALSHCWGKEKIKPQLWGKNYARMIESISIFGLALNFQHAVAVSRSIGVRYLWIDSLCIIQDSELDWQIESTKMGSLYANAVCTISATASDSAYGGCFYDKRPFMENTICVLRKQGDMSLTVTSDASQEASLDKLFDEHVEGAALTKRAWPFQERVLSSRVLHFCDGFVLFECNTLRASEYHIEGLRYQQKPNIRADGAHHSMTEIQKLYEREEHYITTYQSVTTGDGRIRGRKLPLYHHLQPLTIRNPNIETRQKKERPVLPNTSAKRHARRPPTSFEFQGEGASRSDRIPQQLVRNS